MVPIAAGVWQLRGFPANWFNVFLVEDVLIDAGTRWAGRRIFRQLQGHAVREVALTHCHPDHQGMAARVCATLGATLACPEADVPAMEGRAPMQPNNRWLRLGCWLWAGPPRKVDRILRNGDELAGFRVIHAPGHTAGHTIFFRDHDRLALAGDVLANTHFLKRQEGLRQPPPFFCIDPEENRRSIQLLARLEPRIVCFGHGPPLRDGALLQQYAARLAERYPSCLVSERTVP